MAPGTLDKELVLRWVKHLEGEDASKAVNSKTGAGFTVSSLTSKLRGLSGSLIRGRKDNKAPSETVELTGAEATTPASEDSTEV